jgi:hypothetical protein
MNRAFVLQSIEPDQTKREALVWDIEKQLEEGGRADHDVLKPHGHLLAPQGQGSEPPDQQHL